MRLFFLVILFAIGVSSFAQVVGRVVDEEGRPLPDAHLRVKGLSGGTVSQRTGHFALPVPATGQLTLLVSRVGYATREVDVTLPAMDSMVVQLSPAFLQLADAVVISATREEKLNQQVAASVTTLSQHDLVTLSPRSTPEALMGSSGVWVQKTNHGGGSPIIRGLVGNQVLLLVDGIRLNNSTYRYGPNQYLSTVSPWLLDRIEVVRGGGSVMYGSDALGGSVQLLSKTPSFSVSNKLMASGKTFGKWMSAGMEKSGGVELNASNAHVAFTGGLSVHDFGDIVAGDRYGTLAPTGHQEQSVNAKMLVRTKTGEVFTGAYQQTAQHRVPRYDQVVLGNYARYEFDPQIRQLAYVRWEKASTVPVVSNIRLTGFWHRAMERIIAQRNGSVMEKTNTDQTSSIGFTAEATSLITKNWVAQSGIEWYHDYVSSTALERDVQNNEEESVRGSYANGSTAGSLSLFSHHELSVRRLTLAAGGRLSSFATTVSDPVFGNQSLSPHAAVFTGSVRYALPSGLSFLGITNSGFRAPTVDDMSKFGPVEATVFEVPGTSLKPESSFTVESGIRVDRKTWLFKTVVYRMGLSNLIDRKPALYEGASQVDGRNVYQKQNVGQAYVWGVESEGQWQLTKKLLMGGNATYTYGQNKTASDPMRRIPPAFGRAYSQWNGKRFWSRLEWQAAGSQKRLAKGDKSDVRISSRLVDGVFQGWDTWNLYVGYTIPQLHLNLQVSLQNALDASYRLYASGVDAYGRNLQVFIQWQW
jgi:outer membrane receptor protein involved in Fe transport